MNRSQQDYPAFYLAQIRRPGDMLVARTVGDVAYMTGTTNLGFADRVLTAWQSPVLTENAAVSDPRTDRWWVPDFIENAAQDAFSFTKETGITLFGVIVGGALLIGAFYLLAKGE